MVGDSLAPTAYGVVHLAFEVSTEFGSDCAPLATRLATWDRENHWSAPIVAFDVAAGAFTARVANDPANTPWQVWECDISFRVSPGGPGAGWWRISSVVDSPGGDCHADGQTQGPWTISSGFIAISP